jgi:GNAT superfamily N-acetyltransferase
MSFTIDEPAIPTSVTAENAADFVATVAVRNEVEADAAGTDELAFGAAELLPIWLNMQHEPKRLLVARIDGRIVARAIYETSTAPESAHVAWLSVEVLPAARGQGIGTALLERLIDLARSEGRSTLQAHVMHGEEDAAERIVPPTGFGSVPADAPGSRFLVANGFALEQVARVSRLDLPVAPDALDELQRHAADAAPDYLVVSWRGRTPLDYRAAIATLRTRMNTDAPQAGLDADATEWTAERVRDEDDLLEASPRTMLTSLALHVPSGSVAGFSELDAPAEVARSVSQRDTIVLSEHRGHRLGMLLKVANIRFLERELPGHPSILTFNAEENRHMLSVNEAIGFTAIGFEGAWKRVLE